MGTRRKVLCDRLVGRPITTLPLERQRSSALYVDRIVPCEGLRHLIRWSKTHCNLDRQPDLRLQLYHARGRVLYQTEYGPHLHQH